MVAIYFYFSWVNGSLERLDTGIPIRIQTCLQFVEHLQMYLQIALQQGSLRWQWESNLWLSWTQVCSLTTVTTLVTVYFGSERIIKFKFNLYFIGLVFQKITIWFPKFDPTWVTSAYSVLIQTWAISNCCEQFEDVKNLVVHDLILMGRLWKIEKEIWIHPLRWRILNNSSIHNTWIYEQSLIFFNLV